MGTPPHSAGTNVTSIVSRRERLLRTPLPLIFSTAICRYPVQLWRELRRWTVPVTASWPTRPPRWLRLKQWHERPRLGPVLALDLDETVGGDAVRQPDSAPDAKSISGKLWEVLFHGGILTNIGVNQIWWHMNLESFKRIPGWRYSGWEHASSILTRSIRRQFIL